MSQQEQASNLSSSSSLPCAGPKNANAATAAAAKSLVWKLQSAGHCLCQWMYPVPPWVILAVLPFLPTCCYWNRGFTQWFCWMSIVYWLTKHEFLIRFQVLLGICVTVEWYSCLLYEYVVYDRLFIALYKNMPPIMIQPMVEPDSQWPPSSLEEATLHLFQSKASISMVILSHVLDVLVHPIQTWYFWRLYQQRRNKSNSRQQQSITDTHPQLFSWPVLILTFLFSRLWNATHSIYNTGAPAWFYVGHDVYVVNNVDSYYPAHVMETLIYNGLLMYKWMETTTTRTSRKRRRNIQEETAATTTTTITPRADNRSGSKGFTSFTATTSTADAAATKRPTRLPTLETTMSSSSLSMESSSS